MLPLKFFYVVDFLTTLTIFNDFFFSKSLTKDDKRRPKYKQLLEMPLIITHKQSDVSVSDYVTPYINEMQSANSKTK